MKQIEGSSNPIATPTSSTPTAPPIPTEKLNAEILRQVEYYFCPKNLLRDKFLQGEISKDPEGYVPISVLTTFNKLKAMTTDVEYIANVLRNSKSVIVSPDGKAVKTSVRVPLLEGPKPSVTIVDKTFNSKDEMWIFFNQILLKYKQGENIEDKDKEYLTELIKFHEKASEKIGVGIESMRVGVAIGFDEPSICFILKRTDGTEDNFSYNKCILNIFDSGNQNKKNKKNANAQDSDNQKQKKRQREEKNKEKSAHQITPGCVIKIERAVEDQTGEKKSDEPAPAGQDSEPQKSESPDKMDSEETGEKAKQPDSDTQQKDPTENGTTTQKSIPGLYNNNLTINKLKEHFSKYGKALFVELDKNLIYVRFADTESATKALNDDSGFTGPSSKFSLATGDDELQFYERKNKKFQNNNPSKRPRGGKGGRFYKRR